MKGAKRVLSLCICAVMILAVMVFTAPEVDAASYPLMFLSVDSSSALHYAGDMVSLDFTYFPEYHNEKVHMDIYDSDDNLMATVDHTFYNSDYESSIQTFTVRWDTTGYTPGEYKFVISLQFYTFFEWRDKPTTSTARVTLRSADEKPGWKQNDAGWWYIKEDGNYACNEWLEINGTKYFFNSSGYLATGWVWDGAWYYTDSNGIMVTGWLNDGGTWYYFGSDGTMATGVVKIGNVNHEFAANGVWIGEAPIVLKNGWSLENGNWYYYNNDVVVTGWVLDGSTWYYFHSNGVMATGWVQYGNTWYYFHSNGAMATGWVWDGAWYYMDGNGIMVTGWLNDGGTWYYFYSNGAMATNINISGGWIDASGVWHG